MSDYYYRRHVEREILSALLDGELDAEQRRYVHDHLRECAPCREAAEEFGAIKGVVSELPRLVAPEDFVSRALEPRRTSSPRSLLHSAVRGRRGWVLGGLAATALAVSLSGLVAPEEETTPPVDVLVARHVSVNDGVDAVGQVLFAVPGQ